MLQAASSLVIQQCEVFAYRPALRRFAVIVTDITARKRVEEERAWRASFPGLNPNPIGRLS
jgi:hypothetical protein